MQPRSRAVIHAAACAALIALLFPASFEEAAAIVGYEMHVVSFLIGPATYSYGTGLIPGIDYYSQYSVGLPYLFSFFLGPTADATMIRYIALMVSAMFLFYLGAFYLLWWLFGSWRWSAGVTLTTLVLQFHTSRPFFDPSSYVLRYPLLIATVALFVWWFAGRRSWMRTSVLAACLGLSLFLNTETGVYQILGVAFITFLVSPGLFDATWRSLLFILVPGFFFVAISVAAFGTASLDQHFFGGLVKPFFIHGGGYGGWAVDWGFGWQVLYNVIAPGAALATLGWAAVTLKGVRTVLDPSRIATIALVSALAIMMSAKYWNMSIVGLWHVNAFGFLVVLAWWARQFIETYSNEEVRVGGRVFNTSRVSIRGLIALAACLVLFTGDGRNPSFYGVSAYIRYPSILNRVLHLPRAECRRLACAAPRISGKDVEMIASLTKRGERVALLHWNDWAYLIEAQRPSKFWFLPSPATFTRRQLRESLKDLQLVFVSRRTDGSYAIDGPELREALVPLLNNDFRVIAQGRDLVALAR